MNLDARRLTYMLIWGSGSSHINAPEVPREDVPLRADMVNASTAGMQRGNRVAAVVALLGIASVLFPLLGVLLGFLLQVLVPGCVCANESSMCNGCGLDSLISFVYIGGMVGAFLGLVYVLVPALVLAALIWFISYLYCRFRRAA